MKFSLSALTVAAALAVAAGAAVPAAAAGTMTKAPHEAVVTLDPQNGSGQSGRATLTDTPGGLSVTIVLMGAPSGVTEPAHIHTGTCAKLDPTPKYPLASVVNGMSSTIVKGTTLAKMLATPNAINVHKSTKDLKTYVACGNVTAKYAH